MAKKEKSNNGKKLHALYMEVGSLLDLARLTMGRSSHIKALKKDAEYILSTQGEKIGETRLIYFIRSKNVGKFLLYDPEIDGKEHAEVTDAMPDHPEFRSLRIPIMEIDTNPYSDGKLAINSAINVRASDFDSFVKALAAMHEDGSPRAYAFFSGPGHIIGTFDMFREPGTKVFTFSNSPFDKPFSAIRYNYITGKASATDSFTDNSSIYIRVINLRRPFPFFKPK